MRMGERETSSSACGRSQHTNIPAHKLKGMGLTSARVFEPESVHDVTKLVDDSALSPLWSYSCTVEIPRQVGCGMLPHRSRRFSDARSSSHCAPEAGRRSPRNQMKRGQQHEYAVAILKTLPSLSTGVWSCNDVRPLRSRLISRCWGNMCAREPENPTARHEPGQFKHASGSGCMFPPLWHAAVAW